MNFIDAFPCDDLIIKVHHQNTSSPFCKSMLINIFEIKQITSIEKIVSTRLGNFNEDDQSVNMWEKKKN